MSIKTERKTSFFPRWNLVSENYPDNRLIRRQSCNWSREKVKSPDIISIDAAPPQMYTTATLQSKKVSRKRKSKLGTKMVADTPHHERRHCVESEIYKPDEIYPLAWWVSNVENDYWLSEMVMRIDRLSDQRQQHRLHHLNIQFDSRYW